MRPAYQGYHFFWTLLDWIYPPACGGCGRTGERWCPGCASSVLTITPPFCPLCGEPQPALLACPRCRAHPPPFAALRSWGSYGGALRRAILRLKFGGDMGLGEALSKHLIAYYNTYKWDVNLVVPVPLSAARLKQRGYNQSGLLARPLAYAAQIPYKPGALLRTRETLMQSRLSSQERHRNVENAFSANPQLVAGKRILVIDDVTTTGSTISACAQALSAAGAAAVYGLTLARSVLQADADDQQTNTP